MIDLRYNINVTDAGSGYTIAGMTAPTFLAASKERRSNKDGKRMMASGYALTVLKKKKKKRRRSAKTE